MEKSRLYVGIHNDLFGGMTDTGKIIRDGWVFDLIPADETCEGWDAGRIEELWRNVNVQWERFGFSVGALPPPLRDKFLRIHDEGIATARQKGWNPEDNLGASQ